MIRGMQEFFSIFSFFYCIIVGVRKGLEHLPQAVPEWGGAWVWNATFLFFKAGSEGQRRMFFLLPHGGMEAKAGSAESPVLWTALGQAIRCAQKKIRIMKRRVFLNMDNLGIRKKLVVVYVVAFFIPFLVVSVILSVWLQNRLTQWTIERSRSSMTQTATLFKDMLKNVEDLSDTLYINQQVQTTLKRHYESPKEVYEQYMTISFLDDFLQANLDITSIRYYTENSTILDNSFFIKAGRDIVLSDWYVRARESHGKSFWVTKTDNITKRKTLSLVRSMWDFNNDEFIGVLSVNIDYQRIDRFVMNQSQETVIAIDGEIEFSSNEIPEGFSPDFLEEVYSSSEIQSVNVRWKEKNDVALITQILVDNGNSVILLQILPRAELAAATFQGLFIYFVIMILALAFSFMAILFFSKYFNGRVEYINNEIQKVVQNNFEIGPSLPGSDEFASIYHALETTTQNIKKLIDEVYQHKIEQEQLLSRQNDIRFKMLASQINPHFLFNTLETIRMQALSDGNRKVANTIKLLAKILRHNLDVTDRPVPLFTEVEAVSNYLDIQHLRFADRVSYDITYLSDIRNIGILPLLIQPVVENSFIHGLESRKSGGFIYISIECKGKDLFIHVKDNGSGMSKAKLEELRQKLLTGTVENISASIGMVNVNQRIKLFYGSDYGLEIESVENEGTCVTIHVPLIPPNSDSEK